MLEIVFDGTSEGGLRAARYVGSCIITGHEDELDEWYMPGDEDKEIIRRNILFILGNKDFKCVQYAYGLDTGDLSIPLTDFKRKSYEIDRIMAANYYEYSIGEDEFICNALETIEEAMQNNESMRIWLSNNAESMCGFYDLCSRLKDYAGLIVVVQASKQPYERNCWGLIKSYERYRYADRERRLTKEVMYEIAADWEKLKKENSNMRLLVNNELISVTDDYFDHMIFEAFELEEESFSGVPENYIMGNTMHIGNENQLNLHDSVICARIDKLIEEGKIIIVEDNKEKFKRLLKIADM